MGYKIQKNRKKRPLTVTLQADPKIYVLHKKILALKRISFTKWVEDQMKLYRKLPENEAVVKAIKSVKKGALPNAK